MTTKCKPTENETRPLQDAIDENKRLENKEKNLPRSETHVFEMPNIEGGVASIGDLWDCSRSQSACLNLLNRPTSEFTSEILQASPIDKCDTKFRQIRSHEDKIKSLHIDGKMSLEFLLGMIKLEGQFAYDSSTSSNRTVNGILYNYLNEQYRIQLMPRIKRSLLNRDVERMLQRGVIKATHVVGGMIIGAEVTAWIEVTDTSSKEEVGKDGSTSGQITKGVLKCLKSISGGASFKDSDTSIQDRHEIKVSVTTRPAVKQSPTSLDEFLKFIPEFSKDLTGHTHFPNINGNIFGVPIRFILYPISQFVDMEMETLYRELTDACQNDLVSIIAKCNDLRQAGHIWNIILERNHQLHFLQDSKSTFCKEVDDYEKEIMEFAQDIISRSCKALSAYKSGETEIEEIEKIVQEFNKSKASSAHEKARHMADEGTKELQLAYFDALDDSFKSKVKRFTDINECDLWLGKANPRLLLEIKPPCSEAIVKSFLDAAEHLNKLRVDVAIAMPSISKDVCLTIKCNERTTKLKDIELSKGLEVLNAIVVEGYSSINTFHKILGSLCSIEIPLSQNGTSYLDKVFQILLSETYGQNLKREVCFVRSMGDLTTELAKSIDRQVLCLPLGAPDTDLAVVKQFRSLAKQVAFSNFKWIFCYFEANGYQGAPLLLFQSEIVAVCLDNLDILIMMDKMNSTPDESRSNFDILTLTPTRFANTLYPERAQYTLEIMSHIDSCMRLSRSKINGFRGELHDESLNHLMMVIRSTLHSNIFDLVSAIATLVTGTFPSISETFKNYGWCKMEKKFDSAHFERDDRAYDTCKLVNELRKWMNGNSFDAIVQETQQQLINLPLGGVDDSDRGFNEALRRIENDDHCPEVVRKQLYKVKSGRHSLKAKYSQASDILNIDKLKEIHEVGWHHIEALIITLQKCSEKELSSGTMGELAHLYSKRSTTILENAAIENEIKKFLKPYKPYHMLNALQSVRHGPALVSLYEALGELDSLDNSNAVAEIINTVCDVLDKENSEILWKNEQWLFLIRRCLDSHDSKELIDSLSKWNTKDPETCSIPADILDIVYQRSNAGNEGVSGNRAANMSDDIVGHEYSFQSCGEMYQIALGDRLNSEDLQGKHTLRFAENLIAGKAIELVNGDSREIPLAFFHSICKAISDNRPGLRVFVMTLFELRMSQRSSLLSALFSCKYTSSVERHNIRSLFMRMVFLEDSVREAYGYDAIIVLNTEGLRSQDVITSYTEVGNDVTRDWLLTIFAISLSNLTVIDDTLCTEQPSGLECVIEVLVRLKQVNILSDLLISRTFSDTTSLVEASNKIVENSIRTKLDSIISIWAESANYGRQLRNRLDSVSLFLNSSNSGKSMTNEVLNRSETTHENVTNLCHSLLSRTNLRGHKFTFEYWSQLLHMSWNCLKEPQYWLRLREAMDFHELAYFGKKFATAKELLTRTFLIHRSNILKQVRKEYWTEFSATEIYQQLETIPSHCCKNCRGCPESVSCREKLYLDVMDTAWQNIIRVSFQNHRKSVCESFKKLLEMDINELINRQNIAQDLSKQITVELQKIQRECPSGIVNSVETKVDEIWEQLRASCAQDVDEPSEEEQFALIVDKLSPKYENSGFTYDILMVAFKNYRSVEVTELDESDHVPKSGAEDDTVPMTVPKMIHIITQCQEIVSNFQAPKVVLHQVSFNYLHVFKLSNEINHAISKFLTSKRFDCFEAGIKFETVMANEFYDRIVAILTRFEARFNLSIPDELKMLLQINMLKVFFDRIMVLQKKWNLKHNILHMLSHLETEFKAHIYTRLTCGFSCQAEGKLAARYLIMLIRVKATKDEYEENISSFLRIPWVANSETVRIHYFKTLALEIAAGNKETALEHFRNPQTSITKWYKDAAQNHRSGSAHKLFSPTLDKCLQEIRDCKEFSDIDKVIRRYETLASSIPKFERYETEGDDFELMLDSLKSELTQYSYSNDFETFPDVFENSEVRFRLGCTDECFRCGAICWSYLGHSDDEGELSKHYACHQARGLSATSSSESLELQATPCSHEAPGPNMFAERVVVSQCCGDLPLRPRMSFSWKKIETDHLNDWKFQKCITSKYDDLMRWFFQELHVDIAHEKKLKLPNKSTLKKFRYCELKLNNILAAFCNEIN